MPRKDFVKEYMAVRNEVFSQQDLIKKAWQHSGLNPINPSIFREEDYTPSKATSIHMHVPASFPVSEGTRGKTSKLQPDIEEFDFEEGLEPGADSDGES
ncbi:hypothetical protein BDR04DRAFT_1099071, partial [Suillus decipiens]